jgi:enamine deaminase RidA (YjgF/YER057c/UK114 family)
VTIEEGYRRAQHAALDNLACIKSIIGDLDKITQFVKLLCMVNSAPGFTDQPVVADGASDLIIEVFGERGRHARSAVGMAELPTNACIEIEMIVEVED